MDAVDDSPIDQSENRWALLSYPGRTGWLEYMIEWTTNDERVKTADQRLAELRKAYAQYRELLPGED